MAQLKRKKGQLKRRKCAPESGWKNSLWCVKSESKNTFMGFAITWCAVREEKAEQFFQQLGLLPTNEMEEFPESLIASARLDTGWRILWYNKYGCPFLQPQNLKQVSVNQDVIMCLVEEHVMASSAELWSGGKRRWWLSHEGENGPKGLSIDGEPPESFPSIRKEMEQIQIAEGGDDAGVDFIFEIPLKVTQSIVGFKHDEKCRHLVGNHFVIMSQVGPKGGFFQKLFGK